MSRVEFVLSGNASDRGICHRLSLAQSHGDLEVGGPALALKRGGNFGDSTR
jgi:hypothetical protein